MAESGVAKSESAEKQTSLFLSSGSISCSVCLELVTDAGERSIAKLKCGHHFHLDCIGSAFNAKGSMQCPNCRCVEEGQWLYTNGCRRFEDYTVDEMSYEDDYEVYTGIADMFHRPEEMDLSQPHWGPYPSSSHQHASLSFESNPSASSYSDLMANMHYDEHRGLSNQVHGCPYLAAQRVVHPGQLQVIGGNVGIPELREMAIHMAGGSYVGESSARVSRVSVSDRNVRNLHGAAPLAPPHSGISTDQSNLRHERARRYRQASGNHVHGSYNLAFGQSRLHPRLAGSSAPNMAILSHNQVFRDPASSTQNAASPAIRRGLNGIRRRLRVRGFQLASPNAQSSEFFYERGHGTPWNLAPRIDPIQVSDMNGAGWNSSVEGFLGQRNENYGNPWGA